MSGIYSRTGIRRLKTFPSSCSSYSSSSRHHAPLLSVAPMMRVTTRPFRKLVRLMTKQTVLYTEMIVDRSVEHNVGLREVKLRLDEWERPCVVQFGGSDPELLARVARMAVEEYGHEEININVGCPSGRATGCSFGASLMKNPDLVARIVERVKNEVAGLSRHGVNSRSGSVPVTVKHRIGVDQMDSYEELCHFVRLLESAGCDHFIVHARKALLNLKLAKKNRTIPVLNYDMAYALKKDFPNSLFTINGGIKTLEEARKHLEIMDGVMIGRAASANPVMFLKADEEIWGTGSFERVNESIPTRENKEKGTETVSRIKDESHYQQLKHMYNHNDQVTIQKVLTEYAEWADEQILAGKVPHQHALAAFLTMAGAFRNGKALRRYVSGGFSSCEPPLMEHLTHLLLNGDPQMHTRLGHGHRQEHASII